ncbi:uncharacterized protein LOC144877379 [Branchiostoma floridae x Branchiostoma japonicum]
MFGKLKTLLVFLLIVLKEAGPTAACSTSCSSDCNCCCRSKGSVPQYLPSSITNLSLLLNRITALSTSDFSRYRSLIVLKLSSNQITEIQPGTFANLPHLQELTLYGNQITNIQHGVFSDMPQLTILNLICNKIKTIQPGAFSNLPKLRMLYLTDNKMTTIHPSMVSDLPQIQRYSRQVLVMKIVNNPWQCDCSMLSLRIKRYIKKEIICSQPAHLQGQKLIDVSREDLNCEEPSIVSFQRVDNNTLVQGQPLHLVCAASGIPTPDITVTLPSGLNATVESGWRVTVGVNGTITITNVTAADEGLYVCTAANPVGSTSATLSVDVRLNLPTTTTNATPPPVGTTSTSDHPTSYINIASSPTFAILIHTASTTTEQLVSSPTFSQPVSVGSTPSEQFASGPTSSESVYVHSLPSKEPESHPNPSMSVPMAPIAGAAASTVLIAGIFLTICWKRWTRNHSVGPDSVVVSNSTDTMATATTGGHNQMQHHDADP